MTIEARGMIYQASKDPVEYFKDLSAWQENRKLVVSLYHNTTSFPQTKQFGLMKRFRRVAVYIPSGLIQKTREIIKERIS